MTTRFPCTLCGSRDWPREDADCPLCELPDDDEPYEDDPTATAVEWFCEGWRRLYVKSGNRHWDAVCAAKIGRRYHAANLRMIGSNA